MLSGRHAIHHGIYMPFAQGTAYHLGLEYELLPGALRRLGYGTHAVGKWHLGQNTRAALPTGRGFDSYLVRVRFGGFPLVLHVLALGPVRAGGARILVRGGAVVVVHLIEARARRLSPFHVLVRPTFARARLVGDGARQGEGQGEMAAPHRDGAASATPCGVGLLHSLRFNEFDI